MFDGRIKIVIFESWLFRSIAFKNIFTRNVSLIMFQCLGIYNDLITLGQANYTANYLLLISWDDNYFANYLYYATRMFDKDLQF